jgi:hypothetical protein
MAATQIGMIGALLTVVGTALLAYQVSLFPTAGVPGQFDFATLREFYAQELRRQYDFHSARALSLRLALLFCGPFLIFAGTILARPAAGIAQLVTFIALMAAAAAMNRRVAARYDRRLKGLDRANQVI